MLSLIAHLALYATHDTTHCDALSNASLVCVCKAHADTVNLCWLVLLGTSSLVLIHASLTKPDRPLQDSQRHSRLPTPTLYSCAVLGGMIRNRKSYLGTRFAQEAQETDPGGDRSRIIKAQQLNGQAHPGSCKGTNFGAQPGWSNNHPSWLL